MVKIVNNTKIIEHKGSQGIHDELQDKHYATTDKTWFGKVVHNDLKEEHIKIKLLTNGTEAV